MNTNKLNYMSEDIVNQEQQLEDMMAEDRRKIVERMKADPKLILAGKRAGASVEFDPLKIKHAIKPAFRRAHIRYTNAIYDEILDNIYNSMAEHLLIFELKGRKWPDIYRTIPVEKIQDIVEGVLMKHHPAVAKEYILYRHHRKAIREWVDQKERYIEAYKNSSNTANSTVDDNSNVSSKNIGILNNEIHKEDNIQISRSMIKRKLQEIFPDFDAKQYERDLNHHIIYKHDESSFAGAVAPYTYSAKEVIRVLYNGNQLLVPFDLLYSIIEEPECLVDGENVVFQKRPDDLYVMDRNDWVRVTVITKKKRHRDLYRIKTSFGEDFVVTDNHPLITNPESMDETTPAIDSLGMSQWKFPHKLDFRGESEIDLSNILSESEIYESFIRYDRHDLKRIINLNESFGYVVGFFIGDGNYNNNSGYLNFTQKNRDILDGINNILFEVTGKAGYIKYDGNSNVFRLEVRSRALFMLFRNYFHIEDKAQGKTLPINILDFTEDFAKGILEGLYDADGTANYNQLWLKLSSRAAILQASELMRHFGYSVGNGVQCLPFNNSGYKTNYSLWTMSCSRRDGCTEFNMSYKWKKVGISKSALKYKPSGEVKITNVQKINENDSFLIQNDFIYDITTDSHSFILNNILVHNCVALTMYPFLDNGIRGIGGLSAKPKNLDSYCGMLVNMIFAVSAQFAGACLYKDQRLIVRENGQIKSMKISDIVAKYDTKYELHNTEGDWQVAMVNNDLEVWEDGRFVDVTKVYKRKYNDKIYRIHTYGGKTITTSKDHRFKVRFRDRDFEVAAKDLKVNDTLYRTDTVDYPIDKTSKDYKDGQLYGIIAGDGSININGIRVAVNYKETFISDWLDNYFREYKGNPGILRDGHKCYQWEFNSRNYAAWVADNIFDGTDTYTKSLKDEVFENASLEFLCGFLDGILTTDGGYANNTHSLMLTNEKLIKQVKLIVDMLGKRVSCIKYLEKSGKYANSRPAWRINIAKTINPYLDLTSIRRSSNHKYMNDNIKSTYYYGGNAFKYSMGKDKAYCIGDYSKSPVRNLDAIKSIEIIDNDDDYVYEIETSTHWYSAGDILTHNCAVPEALLYFDYFARKEWGDDYYLHIDDIVNPRSTHPRTIHEQIHQHFQQVIYSINQPAAARGLQSAFVNFSYYDKAFFDGMFGNFVFPDFTTPKWESLNWLQQDFMRWFNEERMHCVLTFPVESFAMVYQDGKFLDPENAEFVAQEYARGHSFFTYISDTVDSLSSCCRLKNKIQTKEFNFTNGNMGLQTGSKSVITLNLSRIVQDYCHELELGTDESGKVYMVSDTGFMNGFMDHLGGILNRVYKYHTAYNELLWDMKDAGLLPVYDAGFINLNKQYLTIGINGLNQAAEFLGIQCNDNPEYKKFCQTIFGYIADKNKEAGSEKFNNHTLTYNTEQVPAESLAVKNFNWDKEDGYWVPEDTNLYASYVFKPNDPNISIFDKLKLHGKDYIGDYLDGGAAAHINLEEHLTVEQYRAIINHAANVGCNYFTFNVPMTECKDCGKIVNAPVTKCPECGGSHMKYWVRIIGYLSPVSAWSSGRQHEFGIRQFHTGHDKDLKQGHRLDLK